MIMARNAHVLAFDNLSFIPDWLSDDLAALATGSGFATRELHTDTSEVIFQAARPIIVNGIDDVVRRHDLLSRSFVLDLAAIADDRRRTEEEILAAFDRAHPAVLGALLNAAAKALRCENDVVFAALPRMADAARWIAAADDRFHAACHQNQDDAIQNSLDNDPLFAKIEAFVNTVAVGRTWMGTASALFDLITPTRSFNGKTDPAPKGWPAHARALRGALIRKAPAFRVAGIEVDFPPRSNGDRKIRLRAMSALSAMSAVT
jgi:hypothetical protein